MVHLGSESKGPISAVWGVFTWIKLQIQTDHTERKGGSGDPTWIFLCFRGLDSDGLPPTVGAHCSELRRHLDTHFFDVAEGHQGGDVGKGSRVAIQPIQKNKETSKKCFSWAISIQGVLFQKISTPLAMNGYHHPKIVCFSCYPSSQREVLSILTSTQLIKNSPTSSQGDGEILEFPIRWGR